MQQTIEKEVAFPHVTVQLATVDWGAVEQVLRPPHTGYYLLSQRLSGNHAPLRIGDLAAREAFPRVRSVGFLPPDCAFRLFPVESPFRVLNCVFAQAHFERVTEIRPELWNEHGESLVAIRNKRLEILMQEIYAEFVQPGFAHELLIESAASLLLVEIGRHARQLERKSAKSASSLSLAPWQLRRIQERIQASLEIGYPNLSELAEMCGISQSHLMRSFKASTGWQIHKYIAEERLNTAKRMLAEDQVNSREISARLGFRSPAYFATAFRRMTGKTPSEYRSAVRGGGAGGA